jgi:hypothetical protein
MGSVSLTKVSDFLLGATSQHLLTHNKHTHKSIVNNRLTNRTILWRYVTNDICHDIRVRWLYRINRHRCNVTATNPDVCHEILSRAPWIPNYDEWMERLQLQDADVFMIPLEHSSTHSSGLARPLDVHYRRYPVIDIHPWAFLRLDYLIEQPLQRHQQLGTVYAHATLAQLAKWGSAFLFGLLWRYSFDYAPAIRQFILQQSAVQQQTASELNITTSKSDRRKVLRIGVHSRHTYFKDDGCNIQHEQKCMRKLLQKYRVDTNTSVTTKVPCQVTLASDRTCTILTLKRWLHDELNCTAIVTQHNSTTRAVFSEHGPFSGSGFFQDMLLAAITVKDAMVGSLEPLDGHRWRSSSELIEEAIAYHRDMVHWQAGRNPMAMPDLVECTIKRGGLSQKNPAQIATQPPQRLLPRPSTIELIATSNKGTTRI